ncbi:MAG: hypothetical protein RBR30_07445 [Tenuifilaceae bacterium]|nr:hypothetical protein [Tenuifilaceae bacterium]
MRHLFVTLVFTIFSFSAVDASDPIPPMNKQIVEYVKGVMGQQVERGECWDLAYQALNLVDASWDGMYVYGKPVDFKTEAVYPGDIVHFQDAVVKRTEGFSTITETMEQHTAIILKVYAVGIYELAHQNTSFSGRKVGASPIDLNGLVNGQVIVYRPIPK